MDLHGSGFEVKKMVLVLGIHRSGYYGYQKHKTSPRAQENEKLGEQIRQVWKKSRKLYGSPRITAELRSQGYRYGENRVARIMKEEGIRSKSRKAFRVTTKSSGDRPLVEDLVQRQFETDKPGKIWISDITYIWTQEGWLYLATVMDIFNREIVGWSLHDRLNQDLALSALNQALWHHPPEKGLIFHTDRGGEYRGGKIQKLLSLRGIRPSQGRRGDCYDNAMTESFFSTFKSELIYLERFTTKSEAQLKIYDFIEIYYNRGRRHSALNYQTPIEYANAAIQP
jgi:transposase InsO family protein